MDQDDVPGQAGRARAGQGQPRGRPDEPLVLPRDLLDHWPVDLEVVKVIGVDRGDRRGLPRDAEMIDDTACGFGRVIPALERGDDGGRAELPDVVELDLGPPPRVPPCSRLRAWPCSPRNMGRPGEPLPACLGDAYGVMTCRRRLAPSIGGHYDL